MPEKTPRALAAALTANPAVSALFAGWPALDLPDCWLVAGAVAHSYWNAEHGFDPLHGIQDIDLIYFDPDDLSAAGESRHESRLNAAFDGLGVRLDVKNEARVHLWYEDRFGYPIEAYPSVEAAIETFPTTAGAVAVRPASGGLDMFAPFGARDLLELVVRPNKRQITPAIYAEKAERWKSVWPKLTVVAWD